MDINHKAPVIVAGEIEISASVSLVWQVLSDLRDWPSWNPAVSTVSLYGEFEPGTEFQWKADGVTIISCLQDIEPFRRLLWTGKVPGIRAVHVWQFEERNGKTHVRSEESFDGLLVRLLSRLFDRMLETAMDKTLQSFKLECERRKEDDS